MFTSQGQISPLSLVCKIRIAKCCINEFPRWLYGSELRTTNAERVQTPKEYRSPDVNAHKAILIYIFIGAIGFVELSMWKVMLVYPNLVPRVLSYPFLRSEDSRRVGENLGTSLGVPV